MVNESVLQSFPTLHLWQGNDRLHAVAVKVPVLGAGEQGSISGQEMASPPGRSEFQYTHYDSCIGENITGSTNTKERKLHDITEILIKTSCYN